MLKRGKETKKQILGRKGGEEYVSKKIGEVRREIYNCAFQTREEEEIGETGRRKKGKREGDRYVFLYKVSRCDLLRGGPASWLNTH